MSIVEETSTFSLVHNAGPMSWDTLRKHQDRNFKGEVFEIFINSWVAPKLFGVQAHKPFPDLGSDGQIDGAYRIRFSMKNEQSRVTKNEVSVFHTNGGDMREDDELYFFSASAPTNKAKNAMESLGIHHLYGEMLRGYWEDFQTDLFSYEYQVNPVEIPEMYPHQQRAVQAIIESNDPAVQVIIAMGGGKTRTAAEAVARTDGLTLFAAPTIKIAKQSVKAFEDVTGRKVIQVHSGLGGTTDVSLVSKYINAYPDLIIIAVYNSIDVVAQAASGTKFAIAFADEAHETAGVSKPGEVSYRRTFHFNDTLDIDKRVYLTATRRSVSVTDKARADDGILDAYSMDDETIFGKVVYERTFTECVEDGILVPIAIHAMVVGDDQVLEDIKLRRVLKSLGSEVTALDYSFVRSTLKSLSDYHPEGAQTICFVSSVERARGVENLLHAVAEHEGFSVEAVQYHSDKACSLSDKKLDAFCKRERNGTHRFIVNVRNLAEGYDNPELDAIMYFNAKSTDIGWAQSVSRASRQRQGKELAKVYIPIPIEEDDDKEKVIGKTGYDRVLAIANVFNLFGISIHQLDVTASGTTNLSGGSKTAMSFTMPLNDFVSDVEALRSNVEMVLVNRSLPKAVSMTGQPCPGPANEESEGEFCGKPILSLGHCSAHYNQLRKGIELTPISIVVNLDNVPEGTKCLVEWCSETKSPNKIKGRQITARLLCKNHDISVWRWEKKGLSFDEALKILNSHPPASPRTQKQECRVEGCTIKHNDKKLSVLGLCPKHQVKLQRTPGPYSVDYVVKQMGVDYSSRSKAGDLCATKSCSETLKNNSITNTAANRLCKTCRGYLWTKIRGGMTEEDALLATINRTKKAPPKKVEAGNKCLVSWCDKRHNVDGEKIRGEMCASHYLFAYGKKDKMSREEAITLLEEKGK